MDVTNTDNEKRGLTARMLKQACGSGKSLEVRNILQKSLVD